MAAASVPQPCLSRCAIKAARIAICARSVAMTEFSSSSLVPAGLLQSTVSFNQRFAVVLYARIRCARSMQTSITAVDLLIGVWQTRAHCPLHEMVQTRLILKAEAG